MSSELNISPLSMAKVLLVFYAFVASGYTENILSNQLKEYISSNRMVQHFIGFLVLITLITTIGEDINSQTAILYAIIGYSWFIMSTKLDVHWNVIIILILFCGYLYDNNIKIQNKQILEDPNISDEKKEELIDKNTNNMKLVIYAVFGITILGSLLYCKKKKVQYGGGFDVVRYLLY